MEVAKLRRYLLSDKQWNDKEGNSEIGLLIFISRAQTGLGSFDLYRVKMARQRSRNSATAMAENLESSHRKIGKLLERNTHGENFRNALDA